VIRWTAIAVAVAIAVGPGSARADERAEAILLFEQGSKEMKAGNHAKACEYYEKSLKLYADSGTKGSLARCYEKIGKLGSAWLMWRELADTVGSAELRKDAAKQAEKLEPRVPKYLIKIESPPVGINVTVNGKPSGLTGLPVPTDPGPLVIVATAPEHQEWKTEVTAAEGETIDVTIPVLVKADKIEDKPPPPPPIVNNKRKQRRIVAAGVMALGAGSLGVGGFFGVQARGKFDDAKTTCGGSIDNCNRERIVEAQKQVDSARSAATASSILFIAGGAVIVAGAVLWVTAPAAEKRAVAITPIASPDGAGVLVTGRF
jgi:hypothetical protein